METVSKVITEAESFIRAQEERDLKPIEVNAIRRIRGFSSELNDLTARVLKAIEDRDHNRMPDYALSNIKFFLDHINDAAKFIKFD